MPYCDYFQWQGICIERIVYVGRLDSKEIDFIVRKSDEILYIQVTFGIP